MDNRWMVLGKIYRASKIFCGDFICGYEKTSKYIFILDKNSQIILLLYNCGIVYLKKLHLIWCLHLMDLATYILSQTKGLTKKIK